MPIDQGDPVNRDLPPACDGRRPFTIAVTPEPPPDGTVVWVRDERSYRQRQLGEWVPVAPDERGMWPCACCGVSYYWCSRQTSRKCCRECTESDAHTSDAWGVIE